MMFNWFAPRCPVEVRDRVFVERGLGRLAVALNFDFAGAREVITPLDFSGLVNTDRLTPRAIFNRVIENFGVSPEDVPGDYFDLPPGARTWAESEPNDALDGTDGDTALVDFTTRSVISTYLESRSELIEPLMREPNVVDLCAVLFGAGVYLANATVHESYSRVGRWHSWNISQAGGMPSVLFGYAFAVDAWMRSEELPGWSRFLRRDARDIFADGLRFLEKRGTVLLNRAGPVWFECKPTAGQVSQNLNSPDPAARVNGLCDVIEFEYSDRTVLSGVSACLRDEDPGVRLTACETAASIGEAAAPLFDDVARLSESASASIRALVAHAIGGMQENGNEAVQVLELLAHDPAESVSLAGIRGLLNLPAGADKGFDLAFARLERAILRSEPATTILQLLSEQVDDLSAFVKSRLWERLDPEGRGVLEDELARIEDGDDDLERIANGEL